MAEEDGDGELVVGRGGGGVVPKEGVQDVVADGGAAGAVEDYAPVGCCHGRRWVWRRRGD